jgi:hypothetical protein
MSPNQPIKRTCGVMFEHRRLLSEDPAYVAARSRIETLAREYKLGLRTSARVGITRIPVVVHVVWKTAAQNISEAQIQSQIDVLNQDYRMTNPDIGQVPAVWQSIRGDSRIEFFLATTDPSGNPTNGITRTQTQVESFAQAGNPVKSAATGGADPWPADKYLNIWVCQLGGGLLGYAQFPGGPAATDGVVILNSAFGTTGTAAAPFNRGRTATHEIGHWLNLYHIWGDDGTGCGGSDEVDDTPNAAGPNYGCPPFPSVTCGNAPNGDMFVNYMDYTDDACMYMFTAGQVARMQAALDGPRAAIGSAEPTFPDWQLLDNNLASLAIVADGNDLYQLHNNGRIWKYVGPPMTGWQELDNNPATKKIMAAGGNLYQIHHNGRIWKYVGPPMTGWQELDNNPATADIVADGNGLYQLHNNGRIWKYVGPPMTGWQELDNNPATMKITAAGGNLYQLHNNGRIWKYVGPPMTGWQELDNNPATADIVADGNNLYQLHNNGRIWKYVGPPMTGWQELDNNPRTKQIAAGGGKLYQIHSTGAIWKYVGPPMTGWQQLDNNSRSVAIAAGANTVYQIHLDGSIWKYTG